MKQITLTCNDLQEANQILILLSKCPYFEVAEIIQRFQSQIKDQLDAGASSQPSA